MVKSYLVIFDISQSMMLRAKELVVGIKNLTVKRKGKNNNLLIYLNHSNHVYFRFSCRK